MVCSLLYWLERCNSLPANCAVHSSVPCLCEPTPPLRYNQRAVDAQQQYSHTTCSLTRGRSLACRSTGLRSANWDVCVATRHTRQPSRNRDSVLMIVDKATRMVHFVPCGKAINTTDTGKLLWNIVVKLHGIPRVIYSDRGSQFVVGSWRELWWLTGTRLTYNTAYHPQTQGLVERMNSVISQTIRCLLHDIGNPKDWEKTLPTVELVINLLPNQSTGFSPFYLNYGYEPVTPIQLLKGDKEIKTENVGSFMRRVKSD